MCACPWSPAWIGFLSERNSAGLLPKQLPLLKNIKYRICGSHSRFARSVLPDQSLPLSGAKLEGHASQPPVLRRTPWLFPPPRRKPVERSSKAFWSRTVIASRFLPFWSIQFYATTGRNCTKSEWPRRGGRGRVHSWSHPFPVLPRVRYCVDSRLLVVTAGRLR